MVLIRILGDVVVDGPSGPVALRRVGERLLLAALAVEAGRPVPAQRLLDLLGGEREIATGTLADYAGAVRRALAAAGGSRAMLPPARRSGTYLLAVAPEAVDHGRFVALVGAARQHASAGDHRAAVDTYRRALDLWRGQPLANVGAGGHGLRQRLADEHRSIGYALLTEQLNAGEQDEVVAAARRALQESVPTDQMIVLGLHAMARAGRHAEIPAFVAQAQQRMDALVGTRPGPAVRRLAADLLADPHRSYALLPGAVAPEAPPTPGRPGAPPATPRPGPAEPVRPRARFTLPIDASAFTGRTREIEAIAGTLDRAVEPGGIVAIHAIDGMPGVGKTTLAVHVAYRIGGHFPDGQVFVDLHAHTPDHQPTDPVDALADLLIADGVDPRHLPDGLDCRAALWRDRMAGNRVLILLDNAASSAQVLPLLPGSSGCLVVVTSRRRLADLPATQLPLDILPPGDAVEMFLRLAPRAAGHDAEVAEVVRVCGYLPLAIAITARLFTRHHAWSMPQLLAEMRQRRLTVAAEHHTVAAAFELSFHHLPPARQDFFRLLGLHPGADIDAHAAAALAGTSIEQALAQLDELHADHLVDEPAHRRFRMHDLVRDYARSLASRMDPGRARSAVDSLLHHYARTASHASSYLSWHAPWPGAVDGHRDVRPELATADAALAWLRTERANLIAAIRHADGHGHDRQVLALPVAAAPLLLTDGPWSLAVELHRCAAAAAQRLGDRRGQANALTELGTVLALPGDYAAATGPLELAVELHRAVGDRRGQATALVELSYVRVLTGDYPGASDLLGQALGFFRELGDQRGEAAVSTTLGTLRYLAGDYHDAERVLARARHLNRSLGYVAGLANATCELACVRLATGDHEDAGELLTEALELYRGIGHRRGEGTALTRIGVARRLAGDRRGAAEILERALELRLELGNRHGEAITTVQLAVVRYLDGAYRVAEEMLGRAVAVLHELGAPDDEAEALNHLGVVRRLTGNPGQARQAHERALRIAGTIAHRLEQARALEGLGHAAADLREHAAAGAALAAAGEAYAKLGLPDAARLAADLAALPAR